MSRDPQTDVCSTSECEQVQNLLKAYTHILTKESEKVINKVTDIRGHADDIVESRKRLINEIQLWETNMIHAVHVDAERCTRYLDAKIDSELTKLQDMEEQLQTLLVTLNEVCIKLNLLMIRTFTDNNVEDTLCSIRNDVKVELDKLSFPGQYEMTQYSLVPNITPGQTLVNIRKCSQSSTENGTLRFSQPVSVETEITLDKTIKSRVTGDTFPSVLGDVTVVSPDNVLVVCDWRNKCLKAFYTSYHSRLGMSFKSPALSNDLLTQVDCIPWHVAEISDNTVAVTTNHHQVLLVDVCPSLGLKSRIPVRQFYQGIRRINKTSLAVSYNCSNDILVDIISYEGDVIRTLSTGVVGYVWNTCFDVSPAGDILIGSSSGVLCINHEGNINWKFPTSTGQAFLKPLSICYIGSDSFIVVDRSNRVVCINRVTAESTVLLSILSGILESTCIFVTSSGLLCVTEWRSGKIHLFNMEMNKN